MLKAIIGHADFGAAECVGFDHIRACVQIGGVDRANDVRPGNRKQVVVALLIVCHLKRPAIIGFGKFVGLNRSAIAAVKYQYLLSGTRGEGLARGHAACS